MCGIVGFTGRSSAAPFLLDGLQKLEYRGYDSAGIAVIDGGEIKTEKTVGRIKSLIENTENGKSISGSTGIGQPTAYRPLKTLTRISAKTKSLPLFITELSKTIRPLKGS